MDFMSFEEVKQRLAKTDAEIEEMRKKGELRAFRDGATWKFRKEDIEALAAAAPPADGKEAGDTLMSIDADILFAEEEEVPADSAAETWIAADTEGVFPAGPAAAEQPRGVTEAMSAPETEPAPLALSPETDESSLGAVLSEEELGAGAEAEGPVIAVDAESGLAQVVPSGGSAAVAPSRTRIVTLIEPPAHHGEFTFLLAVTALALACAALVVIFAMTAAGFPANTAIMEGSPQMQGPSGSAFFLMALMGSGSTPLVVVVVVAVIAAIAVLVGYVFQKQRAAREALSA